MNILRVGSITAGGNIILVTTDSGATVYAVSGGKVVSGVAVNGVAKLKVKAGTWRVWAELDGQQTSEVEVIVTDSYYKEMSFAMPLSSLPEGALVKLNESGSGVNFYLAKHDYESGLNGAGRELLVRKDCYDTRKWHSSNANAWASCTLRSWFNGDYLNMIDSSVREMIGTTAYYYTIGNGNNTITARSDAVFQLSVTELGKTASFANAEGTALPTASTLQIAYNDGSAVAQWTRSPNTNGINHACVLTPAGNVNYDMCLGSWWTRPAFTLPNTAMVNPTPNADGSYTLLV